MVCGLFPTRREMFSVLASGQLTGRSAAAGFDLSALTLVANHIELFGRDASIVGRFRALHQDFEDGSGASKFEWDMTLHGPVVGLNIRFQSDM